MYIGDVPPDTYGLLYDFLLRAGLDEDPIEAGELNALFAKGCLGEQYRLQEYVRRVNSIMLEVVEPVSVPVKDEDMITGRIVTAGALKRFFRGYRPGLQNTRGYEAARKGLSLLSNDEIVFHIKIDAQGDTVSFK